MANLEAVAREYKEVSERLGTVLGHVEGQRERLADLEQRMVHFDGAAAPASMRGIDSQIFASFVDSQGFGALKNGLPTSGRVDIASGVKAALTNPDRGGTTYPTQPNRADGIKGIATPALTLLDILSSTPVTSGTFEFVTLDGYVNAATYQVNEGDDKAETDMPTKLQRAEIATIAHWLPASKQVLEDNGSLESQIRTLMSVGLRQKLEAELVNGAGGEGEILGLVPQATAFTTSYEGADAIGQAIVAQRAAGWTPSAIIMNPMDWFDAESIKNVDGNYVMGSPRDPAPASLWGVPVIQNASMPQGQALVMDASTVSLLDRQQVTVEASRHDGRNFIKNLVTILAELRAGLAVYAPSALSLVTLEQPAG